MATMASPTLRHNGVVMGTPVNDPAPVATVRQDNSTNSTRHTKLFYQTPSRPADPMAFSSILSNADPSPKPTPPATVMKHPRKASRHSETHATFPPPISRDSSRQSSAAPAPTPVSRVPAKRKANNTLPKIKKDPS